MILRSKSYNLLCLMASPKFKQSKFEPILLTSLVSSLSLLMDSLMEKQWNIFIANNAKTDGEELVESKLDLLSTVGDVDIDSATTIMLMKDFLNPK